MTDHGRELRRVLEELRYIAKHEQSDRQLQGQALTMAIDSALEELDGGDLGRAALATFNAGMTYVMWQHVAPLDAKTQERCDNLKPRTSLFTDDDILRIVNDTATYPTRADQAKKLDMGVRGLQKRIKKLRESGKLRKKE